MERLLLSRFAPYDAFVAPVVFTLHGMFYYTFFYLYLHEHYLLSLWPTSTAIAILIVIFFMNSLYFLKKRNYKTYLFIRLPLQMFILGCYAYQDAATKTVIPTVRWNFLGNLFCFVLTFLGVYSIMEKVEMGNYHCIKEKEMARIYRRKKWTFLKIPVKLLLYGQVFCATRFILIAIPPELFSSNDKPSLTEAFAHDWVNTTIFLLAQIVALALAINAGFLIFGVIKKSGQLLIICYYFKVLGYLLLIALFVILILTSSQLTVKLDNPEKSNPLTHGLNDVAIAMLETFEYSQILRFYTYITLESEMPVGEYSFRLQEVKPGKHFFSCDFDKSAKRFVNSVRIAASRITVDSDLLGEGQFAKVLKGTLRQLLTFRRIPVAVKIIKNLEVEDFDAIITELKILSFVSNHNENLVGFYGCCKLSENHLGIILEFVGGGSLLAYLAKLKTSDSWEFQRLFLTWSMEIADGMEFLSSKKIIHGDLAARNILLTNVLKCKISDFGMAFRLRQYEHYVTSKQTIMPFRWMAPESLSDLKFSTQSDIWSYGVLVWEIYSLGNLPWNEIPEWNTDFVSDLQNGIKLQKPILANETLYQQLLLSCWQMVPENRPSFSDIKLSLQIQESLGV